MSDLDKLAEMIEPLTSADMNVFGRLGGEFIYGVGTGHDGEFTDPKQGLAISALGRVAPELIAVAKIVARWRACDACPGECTCPDCWLDELADAADALEAKLLDK